MKKEENFKKNQSILQVCSFSHPVKEKHQDLSKAWCDHWKIVIIERKIFELQKYFTHRGHYTCHPWGPVILKKILNDNGPKLLFGQRIVRRRSTSNLFFFSNLLSSSFELLLFTQKKSRLFIITNFDFIYCLNYRTASLIMKIGLFFGSFYFQLNSIRLKILYLPSSNINETFYVDFKSF